MTMWTTEAINAEIEYRRESLSRLAKLTRIGRQRRAQRAEHRRAEHGTAERAERHRATTLHAQRASGDHAAAKQPV